MKTPGGNALFYEPTLWIRILNAQRAIVVHLPSPIEGDADAHVRAWIVHQHLVVNVREVRLG